MSTGSPIFCLSLHVTSIARARAIFCGCRDKIDETAALRRRMPSPLWRDGDVASRMDAERVGLPTSQSRRNQIARAIVHQNEIGLLLEKQGLRLVQDGRTPRRIALFARTT